ncbi:MAG TPA: hypothetical protein VN837_03910 [Chloroflexota bacterium]|nr:hypothetical protein [Chloroflexota bacterium]
MVDACAVHVISRHDIPALLCVDEDWGIATRRQRALLRFALFARLTNKYGYLRALGTTIQDVQEILDLLWSSGIATMALYPAYRQK